MSNDKPINRRALLKGSLALTAGLTASRALAQKTITPSQVEGPFYPINPQTDRDLDLTQIRGHESTARGEAIWVTGKVLDENGKPLVNAIVDVWQANSAGRYAHHGDTNSAPLDPNFQGWGIVNTDESGQYRLKTIKPGAYAVSGSWSRPPHIHFKVSKRGFFELTTQMYFANEALNDTDGILNDVPEPGHSSLIVDFALHGEFDAPVGQFDIILRKV